VCSQGGLKDGMIVELANLSLASILEANETTVKLDANNMMAGWWKAFMQRNEQQLFGCLDQREW